MAQTIQTKSEIPDLKLRMRELLRVMEEMATMSKPPVTRQATS
jgi:hypothetical protein